MRQNDLIDPMAAQANDPNEQLFSIVEFGLIERIAKQDIPDFLTEAIKAGLLIGDLVFAAWTIYHEADCAKNQKNRTAFTRYRNFIMEPIDERALFSALIDVVKLMRLNEIAVYRTVTEGENKIFEVFLGLIDFYRVRFGL